MTITENSQVLERLKESDERKARVKNLEAIGMFLDPDLNDLVINYSPSNSSDEVSKKVLEISKRQLLIDIDNILALIGEYLENKNYDQNDQLIQLIEHHPILISQYEDFIRTLSRSSPPAQKEAALNKIRKSLLEVKDKISRLESNQLRKAIIDNESQLILEGVHFWTSLREALLYCESAIKENGLSKADQKQFRALVIRKLLNHIGSFEDDSINETHISLVILNDIIEGRIKSTDEYFNETILNSLENLDEIDEGIDPALSPDRPRKNNLTRTIATTILILSLAGPLVSSTIGSNNHTPRLRPTHIVNNRESTTETVEESSETLPSHNRMSIPENSGQLSQTLLWTMEGRAPSSHFRTQTASHFRWDASWIEEYNPSTHLSSLPTSPSASSDLTLTSAVSLEPGYSYPLPVPADYTLDWLSIDDPNGDWSVWRNDSDGTYSVSYRARENTGARITFGMSHSALSTPVVDDDNLLRTTNMIENVSDLPLEVNSLLQRIENMSDQRKIQEIQNFIERYFVYSLDPMFNSLHRPQSRTTGVDYIRNVFEYPYGDCDVISTATIALLRQAGIPARIVYGYSNSRSFVGSSNLEIKSGQGHAWVAVLAQEGWQDIDPKPIRIDKYTRDSLRRFHDGDINEYLQSLLSEMTIAPDLRLQLALNDLKQALLSLANIAKDSKEILGFISFVAVYAFGLFQENKQSSQAKKEEDYLLDFLSKSHKEMFLTNDLRRLIVKHTLVPESNSLMVFAIIPSLLNSAARKMRVSELHDRHHKSIDRIQSLTDLITNLSNLNTEQIKREIMELNQDNIANMHLGNFFLELSSIDHIFQDFESNMSDKLKNEIVRLVSESESIDGFLNSIIEYIYLQYLEYFRKKVRKKIKKDYIPIAKDAFVNHISVYLLHLANYWNLIKESRESF